MSDFDWIIRELVVQPARAVAVYFDGCDIVIRQQKKGDQNDDDMVLIPAASIPDLIKALQTLAKEGP